MQRVVSPPATSFFSTTRSIDALHRSRPYQPDYIDNLLLFTERWCLPRCRLYELEVPVTECKKQVYGNVPPTHRSNDIVDLTDESDHEANSVAYEES